MKVRIVQKRTFKFMVLFMSFIVALGTFIPGPASYAAEAEVDPLAPQNLRVVQDSITATTATIEWDSHVDKEIVDIDIWNVETGADTWGNYGSKTLDKLTPETTYKFYITWHERPATRAHKSNVIEFTTLAGEVDPGPPTNIGPRNLSVVDVTHNTVSLKWDPVPGIKAYWIWDQNNKYIFWANDGAQVVGGLEPETTYSFYVGADGIQAPNLTPEQKSNIVTFTTLEDMRLYPAAPLVAPSYLKVTDVTDASVTLNWGASPQATGYDLYVNGGWMGGTWENSVTTITYAPAGGLIIGETYNFEVGAQNPPNPVSANSNKVTITWGELESPKDVKIVTATRTTASLGWAPSPGATSYDIYQDDTLVGSSDSNRYVATGLTEGQSYSIKVVAKNSLWESSESSDVKVVPGSNYNIVTYYTSWSVSEDGRNFKPSEIDVSQITHINYAFSDLCWKGFGTGATACQNDNIPLQKEYVFDGEMVIGDPEVDLDNFNTLATIRDQNPNLKLLVSAGGWTWSKNFSNMAATEETRRAFANSIVKFLREYRLDGIDIDWEYPVEGGEPDNSRRAEDKENYPLMVKTVREALDAAGSEDGKYYLQTIASGQGDNFTVNADFVNSASYLDFINIMTYDYSGSWETLAHHNAPLYYDINNPFSSAPRNNVQGGVVGHLNGGVPNYKLVVGIPFYGKGWRDCPTGGQYQTCAGGTQFGSWESGIFDFSALENDFVNKNGYVRYWNDASKVAYLYNSEEQVFITYNDKESMMYTASFLKSLDLAGVMSWEISGDRNRTLSTELVNNLPIDGSVNTSALAIPQNLLLTSSGQNDIQVKWDAIEEATGYEIFMNKQYVGYTTARQYKLSSLAAGTNYKIHVIAIVKDNDQIQKVSIESNELSVTTQPESATPPSTPSVSYPSSGGVTPTPTKVKNQLDARITKDGDKLNVTLQLATSLATINESTSSTFRIVASDKAKQVEVIVPKEIVAAIAKKGEQATLSIVTNGVEYIIPIRSVDPSKDIKITIESSAQTINDQLTKLLQDSGMKQLVSPLEFKIEQINADKTSTEIKDFGNHFLSRKFILDGKEIDVSRITGVVFIPGANEIRSVPTLFTVNADGTVTVELKRQGNSIYSIVSTDFNFQDVTADWAQKDITQATTKLIVSGESVDQFGSNSHITRAEVASMIVKALGLIPNETSETYKDVDPQSKYAREIAAANKAGFIHGKTENTFGPNDKVTRQELAVMLANAMKYAGKKQDADLAILNQFSDQKTISSYAKASLALMVEQKIIQGVSPTKLDPQSNVTKAQAAVTVMRTLRTLGLSN
ncbi:glycosyl hydrolase family 18 protein [Paenibacillus sp. FA6]|uniref:glycosyl hydrolase family 18 protein n=1 Tax=Paenibacillus sp. FA6 TaxID=3413029 RepID=UPI003F66034A